MSTNIDEWLERKLDYYDKQGIQFTQFLMPNGRQRAQWIKRPEHIEAMAKELLKRGCNFEIEMLSTGEISMEVMRGEESVAHEICANGPAVPPAVDSIVTQAFRIATANRTPARLVPATQKAMNPELEPTLRTRKRSTWAVRTIRNGAVRIYGETFRPKAEYHGELEGERMVFGLYRNFEPHRYGKREFTTYCCCHSLEECKECPGCNSEAGCKNPRHWPGPTCINGVFVFEFWSA